jgi:hypothetical protein
MSLAVIRSSLRGRRLGSGVLVRVWQALSECCPGDTVGCKTSGSYDPYAPRRRVAGTLRTGCWTFPSSSMSFSSSSMPFSFSSSSSAEDANAAVKTLLQSLRAVDFLPHLMELKKTKSVMTMEDLEMEFHMALPLASDEDGRRILTAMAASGLILKAGDVVYMDPGGIAKTLRSVLPIDVPLMKRRLEEVVREVGPMVELKERVEAKARRKSMLVNTAFLGFLSIQWGVFIRLCYWELSWDVVEPLGFFAGGLTTIVGFAWAIMTRRSFSYESLNGEVRNRWVDKELERQGFDFLAYDRLIRERERLLDSLRLAEKCTVETRESTEDCG